MAAIVCRFLLSGIWERLKYRQWHQAGERRLRANRLCRLLVELGPTFIKVGQFLSARRDVLPSDIADELALLQDQVPAVPPAIVRSLLQAHLGCDPAAVFQSFNDTPIASASIGQVHLAQLFDGTPVALKVQRPDLPGIFDRDLGYMRLACRVAGQMGWINSEHWLSVIDEFGKTLFAEIDYLQEGRNADRLRAILRDWPQVKIPRVFWRYTGRRIIAFQYLPGLKIDRVEALKAQGLNLKKLANLLFECYLQQVASSGFFHADPHAGNLAVDAQGNLIIYDFGMMGCLSESDRQALALAVTAICQRRPETLVEALLRLGVIAGDQFRQSVLNACQPLIEYYSGQNILDLNFAQVEQDIEFLLANKALALPANLAYLARTLSSLEGVARTLRPNFSFVQAARPFLSKLAEEQLIFDLKNKLEDLAVKLILEMPRNVY